MPSSQRVDVPWRITCFGSNVTIAEFLRDEFIDDFATELTELFEASCVVVG